MMTKRTNKADAIKLTFCERLLVYQLLIWGATNSWVGENYLDCAEATASRITTSILKEMRAPKKYPEFVSKPAEETQYKAPSLEAVKVYKYEDVKKEGFISMVNFSRSEKAIRIKSEHLDSNYQNFINKNHGFTL